MPAVSEAFETYREFAGASLQEIYGERLDAAYAASANHLRSGVWINEGGAGDALRLRWEDFPWAAQLAPVNAIAAADFDRDGMLELALGQGHFTNQVETGLWRGSPGCHLEWTGETFAAIPHADSGLVLPGDTKALVAFDADGDGRDDLLAGQNNAALLLFRSSR